MVVHCGDESQGTYHMANRKVIKLKQWDHEYWLLSVMVTDNQRMLEGGLPVDSVEDALKHIEVWLRKAWTTEPRWLQRKREQNVVRSR